MKHTKGNCLIPYWDEENEEQEANSKLIAAASDLLEALKLICEETNSFNLWSKNQQESILVGIKAIQKATQ